MQLKAVVTAIVFLLALRSSEAVSNSSIGLFVRLHWGINSGDAGALGPLWHRIAKSALMAVHHVNTRNPALVPDASNLLPPGFHMDYNLLDTYSSPRLGIEKVLGWAEEGRDMVVGAWRSAVSGPISLAAEIHSMPVMSWGSTSASLSGTKNTAPCCRLLLADFIVHVSDLFFDSRQVI